MSFWKILVLDRGQRLPVGVIGDPLFILVIVFVMSASCEIHVILDRVITGEGALTDRAQSGHLPT